MQQAKLDPHILLVDDEEKVRDVLFTVLTCNGYNVIKAVDGLDALEKFRLDSQCISLVVTDISMPRMDGIKSFKEMNKIDPTVKVLFITAYLSDQLQVDGPVLMKPFTNRKFLDEVKALLS